MSTVFIKTESYLFLRLLQSNLTNPLNILNSLNLYIKIENELICSFTINVHFRVPEDALSSSLLPLQNLQGQSLDQELINLFFHK